MPWKKETTTERETFGIAARNGEYDLLRHNCRSFEIHSDCGEIRLNAQRFSGEMGFIHLKPVVTATVNLNLSEEEAGKYLAAFMNLDRNNHGKTEIKIRRHVPDSDISYAIEHSLEVRETSAFSVSHDSVERVIEIRNQAKVSGNYDLSNQIQRDHEEAEKISIHNALKGATPKDPAFKSAMQEKYAAAYALQSREERKPEGERDYSAILKTYLTIIKSLPFEHERKVMHKLEVLLPSEGRKVVADGYELRKVATKDQQRLYEEAREIAEDAMENVGFPSGKFSSEESCLKYVCTPEAILDHDELSDVVLACLSSADDAVEIRNSNSTGGYVLSLTRTDRGIGIEGTVMRMGLHEVLGSLGERDLQIEFEKYYDSEFEVKAAQAWKTIKATNHNFWGGAYSLGAGGLKLGTAPFVLFGAGMAAVAGVAYKYLIQAPKKVIVDKPKAEISSMLKEWKKAREAREQVIATSLASRLPQNKGRKGCVILVDPACETKLKAGELLPPEKPKAEASE